MVDEKLIRIYEETVLQTRNAQSRLIAKLREAEADVEMLKIEINALENSAVQTERAIDRLLLETRAGNRAARLGSTLMIEEDSNVRPISPDIRGLQDASQRVRPDNTVTFIHQNRSVPTITNNFEALSNRFSDRTITQACRLLLREAGRPLHVNELYNMLVAGGMKFKGNNPTISVAVSLSRNSSFIKVDPGTFDLDYREAYKAAS